MAAKAKENRAQRDCLKTQMFEIWEVAKSSQEQPSLRALLKRRFARAQSIFEKFEPLHSAILAHTAAQSEPDFAAEEQIRREFFEAFDEIEAIYVNYFPEIDRPASTETNQSTSSSSNLRLPKLSLRNFNGNFSEWSSFIQFFNNAVHSRADVAQIEKFQYLLSCLSGEPLNLVKALTLSEENYPIAYKALVDRYENKRRLSYHYWNNIQALPKLKSESSQGLRETIDKFTENRSALLALNLSHSLEDFMWLQLLLEKLDPETRKQFEAEIRSLGPAEVPKYTQLAEFVESQCRVLDSLGNCNSKSSTTIASSNPKSKTKSVLLVDSSSPSTNCSVCAGDHHIYKCPDFVSKTPRQRFEVVKSRRLCINCLRSSHQSKSCPSKSSCRSCMEKHHTMLHFNKNSTQNSSTTSQPSSSNSIETNSSAPNVPNSQLTTLTSSIGNKIVLLATAVIEVKDMHGNFHRVRVILDNCSQGGFITQKCLRRLGLRFTPSKMHVKGINPGAESISPGFSECLIRPRNSSIEQQKIIAHVLPNITGDQPSNPVDISRWKHISNLNLADPEFNSPHRVEMLLGGDVYATLLRPGVLLGTNPGEPAAINTIFGWVINGPVDFRVPSVVNTYCTIMEPEPLEASLKRLWELEEVPNESFANPDDIQCERLYAASVTRGENGRYTVALPFKSQKTEFPNSRDIAVRRFLLLENRLIRNPALQQEYVQFMRDYLDSNHMSRAPPLPENSVQNYYIPHHCILRPDSSSTKLRVVFDASAKASNGQSLNDTLYSGPKLLQDIVKVLLKFRLHRVVFTADIRQMYRQILISPKDRDFQRIIWRSSPDDALEEYVLNTVTYGISSAPFLAIRTLLQLADDEQGRFPGAAEILRTDVYMDDIVTGCHSTAEALELQDQLIKLLQIGQFELRKWASNSPLVVDHLDPNLRQVTLEFDQDKSNSRIKILGLQWLPSPDTFSFKVNLKDRACTKRNILSEVARIFDPLGFLAPLTFFAKHLIQHLWCLGLSWDDVPPQEVIDRWGQYLAQLPEVSEIKINRHLSIGSQLSCELHGFCDASEIGFAAAVYLRVTTADNEVSVNLVMAKTKVAPLKRRSLPQLELCGAQLLSKLIKYVRSIYESVCSFASVTAWTDSMIVLGWLRSSPHRWKTFVSNRVAYIQEKISPASWRYIRSSDNPADCASRGLLPAELKNHPLWWNGPTWLRQHPDNWPIEPSTASPTDDTIINSETRRAVLLISTEDAVDLDRVINKFSSLSKIENIVAYLFYFAYNCRVSNSTRRSRPITKNEHAAALKVLVKHVQRSSFLDICQKLKTNQACPKSIQRLAPFLDEDEIIRVGGRLSNSRLCFNEKHPALLPRSHRFTRLLIEHTHKVHLHPGLKTLHFLLLQNFWILSPQRTIRSVCREV
jgi:hypothetical protein